MSLTTRVLYIAPMLLAAVGCAKGAQGDDDGTSPQPDAGGAGIDAISCGASCDSDGDGVVDGSDECPATPPEEVVNDVGCGDSQVSPTLEPEFPPLGLTWTPTGDLGRVGGLTWTYTGIERADLFHIYWVICDDPATPCGLSLDGPVDAAGENWAFTASGSDLPGGKVVFTNTTHILLADGSSPALSGRLSVTVIGSNGVALPVATLATLGITGRDGEYGAEIPGPGFTVRVLAEVEDTTTSTWTPYLDYYDAAATPDTGAAAGNATVSFGGSFYDE
jgi:hypothetical protein